MKINVDTKEDSVEDIKNLILMLQQMIGDSPSRSYVYNEKSSGPKVENVGDMFADTSSTSSEEPESISEPVTFGGDSPMSMFDSPAQPSETPDEVQVEETEEDDQDKPELQVY